MNWAIKEFSLRDVDVDKFSMTGKELCRITRDEFLKLAPAYNGDILMAHLCVLRKGESLSILVRSALFNNVRRKFMQNEAPGPVDKVLLQGIT